MADEPFQRLRRFLAELKRRNVYKVAVTYLAVAFVGLQAVDLLIPATTLPPWADAFFVAVLIVGFPVALVTAWAFEMTPEGVRRTEELEGEGSVGAGYQWVGLALVVVLAGGVWYIMPGDDEQVPPEPAAAGTDTARAESLASTGSAAPRLGDRSIAVLPFEALGQQEPDVFTEGMHDDLLARLSNVADLKVISRTAVQQYRGSDKTTGEIARELGVRWVLEGGVQEMADQIQVNAQLIDPRTDTHAWADTYRRDLTTEDLFVLQSEITKRIARSLEVELTPAETERVERRPTEDLEAYQLYVEGRIHLDTRTEVGLRRGMELFREALARDSSYTLAWSGLADAKRLLAFYGHAPADSMIPQSYEAARRALEVDPRLAEAHASLAGVHIARHEGIPALRHLRRAVELKPSYARAHHWLGNLYARLGFPEQKLRHLRNAAELDPRSPPVHTSLARVHWWIDGPGETALDFARRSLDLEPDYSAGHLVEGLLHSDAGRYEEAVSALQNALDRVPEGSSFWSRTVGALGINYARAGDTARAREQLDRLKRGKKVALHIAAIHATLGDEAAAFQALENVEWGDLQAWLLRSRPAFDPLRDDPRFEALIQEANRAWGLNPDGSLPDSVDVSFEPDD